MDRLSVKGSMIEQVDLRGVPHSGFDRSNHNFGTCKLGKLVPMRLDEVYPGDRIKGKPEIVANFEPLAAPIMGSMVLKQESWYVPYYQVWRNYYNFITGKKDGLSIPTKSPKDIWEAYKTKNLIDPIAILTVHQSSFNAFFIELAHIINNPEPWDMDVDTNFLTTYFDTCVNHLKTYGNLKLVLDILQPQIDRIEKFYKVDPETGDPSELISLIAKLKEIDRTDYKQNALAVCDLFTHFWADYYNYFFGPSSFLDYIGFPINDKAFKWFNKQMDYVRFGTFDGDTIDILDITYIAITLSTIPLSFLPFRSYYLVWYWNYRDQLLEKDVYDPEDDEFTGDTVTDDQMVLFTLLRVRCWYKDTFTTALTNTGDGNLLVPTNKFMDDISVDYYNNDGQLVNTTDRVEAYMSGATVCSVTSGNVTYRIPMNYLSSTFSSGDLTDATSNFVSLDLFDRISRLRRFLQKKLILGYEVDDVVYSSFLVKMSNVRIHIPEMLGRGRDAVQMNTVVNNTNTAEQIAGDKTAVAWAQGTMSELNYFSEDWGYYIHIATVLPIQSYAGGIQRLWLKKDQFDFMWPEFATMGMDAVYNCELASMGSRLTDEQALLVFGYQGRYYDLKSRLDEEHGRLLTDLNYLTFSRDFDKDNPPKLNYIFVHCWPQTDMFVADDPDVDLVRYDCYHGMAWERRLPVPSEFV